uniref:Uncharacterized protein n=1 Tax=Mycena chlorophos TaxID=658473 RepID=A0ABQ0LTE0_MYCCL|nr:predicted protein [Mycena chlorophos]
MLPAPVAFSLVKPMGAMTDDQHPPSSTSTPSTADAFFAAPKHVRSASLAGELYCRRFRQGVLGGCRQHLAVTSALLQAIRRIRAVRAHAQHRPLRLAVGQSMLGCMRFGPYENGHPLLLERGGKSALTGQEHIFVMSRAIRRDALASAARFGSRDLSYADEVRRISLPSRRLHYSPPIISVYCITLHFVCTSCSEVRRYTRVRVRASW